MTVTWPFRETRRFSPAFIVNVTVPWSNRTETVNAPAYGVPTSSAYWFCDEEARPAVDDPRVGDRRRRRGHDPDDAAVLVVLAVIADHLHDQPVEARLRRGVAGVLEPADAPPADVQRAVAVEVAERHDVAAAIVEAGGGFSMKTPPPVLSRMRVAGRTPGDRITSSRPSPLRSATLAP